MTQFSPVLRVDCRKEVAMRDLNDADTGYEVRWARFCVYRPRSPGQVPPKMGSERPAFDAVLAGFGGYSAEGSCSARPKRRGYGISGPLDDLCVYIPRSPGQVPPKRPDFHPRSGHLNRGPEALDAPPHPHGPGPFGNFSLHTKWYGIEWIGNWYWHI